MPKSEHTEIDAHCFTLRDTKGRKAAMLTTNDDDEAFLAFFGKDGKYRLAVGLTKEEECRIVMLDKNGDERCIIAFLPDENQAVLQVNGGPGKPAIGFRGGWQEGAGLGIWGGTGALRAHVGIGSTGVPNFMLLNPGNEIVWRAVKDDGTRTSRGGIIMPAMPKVKTPVAPTPPPKEG